MNLGVRPERPDLYRWQFDALTSWLRCGRRGVVEAVTGSGKTDVALAAASDALRRGRFVLVLVPSRVLMEQWHGRLTAWLPHTRIGRLGDTLHDQPADCDVLIATRHSAAAHKPVPPGDGPGLLIADECHGLGGGILRRALLPQYEERLGLTATLERSDDAVTDLLLPFFGGICHRYGFGDAIADGVCAPPRVALVGVPLSAEERHDYIATEQQLVDARHQLRRIRGMPLEPFGAFLAAVAHLADNDAGPEGRAARDYLDAFAKRRSIVAQSVAKYELLGRFAPVIKAAEGAVLFTETVRAANHAINRLDPLVSIDLITGATARRHRKVILDDLRTRRLDAVAAPRVLDEGIDVPDANLGIVMSASRTRRQMIQRMGRILRRKRPGVAARFVIMFAQDTLEDPANRLDRDGFLDEIERIAEAVGVYDAHRFDELEAFMGHPGPAVVPEPERLAALDQRFAALLDVRPEQVLPPEGEHAPSEAEQTVAALADDHGPEAVYAYAAFARPEASGPGLVAARRLEVQLPPPPEEPDDVARLPYLEPDLSELPELHQPKQPPKRLSTGEAPLVISAVGPNWQLTCTGCGATSPVVRFRWQALEQTVACACR
ncbi:MAG: DEAD/DEAH box helicase [Acidimicrobiia bacterium]|nr:DEAD/DEAH box helicase [Acidimicrobiia bacterium]